MTHTYRLNQQRLVCVDGVSHIDGQVATPGTSHCIWAWTCVQGYMCTSGTVLSMMVIDRGRADDHVLDGC
jgi:hypothetical protein